MTGLKPFLALIGVCLLVGFGILGYLGLVRREAKQEGVSEDHLIKSTQGEQYHMLAMAQQNKHLDSALKAANQALAVKPRVVTKVDSIPVIAHDPRDQGVIDSLTSLVNEQDSQLGKVRPACVRLVSACALFRDSAQVAFKAKDTKYQDLLSVYNHRQKPRTWTLGGHVGYGATLLGGQIRLGPQVGVGLHVRF